MFRQWIEPLKDLGVLTVYDEPFYPANQSTFSEIGLPGVMFLHDPFEYFTHARHSNLDTIERVAPDELAQSATVLAVFLAASASAQGHALTMHDVAAHASGTVEHTSSIPPSH
ncbi:MAG: peptidase [Bradyrhizobium sp.]|nr:peptidase [Bradyrhizobium sp.]